METIKWTKEYNIENNFHNIKMLKIFVSEHHDNIYFSTIIYLEVIEKPDFSKGIDGEYIMQMSQMNIADNENQAIIQCEEWIKSNLGREFKILDKE